LNFAVLGRSSKKKNSASPSVLEIFSFDTETTSLSTSPQVCFSDTLNDMSFKLSLFRQRETLFCFYIFGALMGLYTYILIVGCLGNLCV
jgi:hypothetical protein